MTRVLVTGSSGFIGTNLCRALVDEGYDVFGIDIEPPHFELPNCIDLRAADLLNYPELPETDIIIHLAAYSQVQPIVENPEFALENIEMTYHVLREAERLDATLINASSRDIYGDAFKPSEEEATPDSPNEYAASKIGSEALVNAYGTTRNVPVTSLRLANVYGPMDTNRRVIPIFIGLASAGRELTVYGHGKVLDFVHVGDVCDAMLTAVQRTDVIEVEAINIGSGVGTSLTEVADTVAGYFDSCPGWTDAPDRTGDVDQYVSDISKAEEHLGYVPEMGLTEGLDETIDWYLDHQTLLSSIREGLGERGIHP